MDRGLLLRSVQKVIQQRKQRVKSNPSWKALTKELGIGRLKNGFINFSHQEIDYLEAEYDRLAGRPLLEVDLSISDRSLMANEVNQEKWAKGGVFEVMMVFAKADLQPIPVKKTNVVVTPEGTVISLMPDKIDVNKINALLIIENGAVMVHWAEMISLLPEPCRDALFVYRGHGSNLSHLQTLLQQMPTERPVFIFFDFDAAGFTMAKDLNKLHPVQVLIPTDWDKIHTLPRDKLQRINKPKVFIKQKAMLSTLQTDSNLTSKVQEVINYLQIHKIAITQEHIVQQQWSLKCLDFNNISSGIDTHAHAVCKVWHCLT
jgi:hypothetical protein